MDQIWIVKYPPREKSRISTFLSTQKKRITLQMCLFVMGPHETTSPLTHPEQSLITQYKGPRLVVKAYAGTGKTTTLVKYARNNLDSRILCPAYNRAIRDEGKRKFPANVDCKTSHQRLPTGKGLPAQTLRQPKAHRYCPSGEYQRTTFARYSRYAQRFMYGADMRRVLYTHFARAIRGKVLTRPNGDTKSGWSKVAELI